MARVFNGKVIAMGNKTAVVEVGRQTPHPLYRKLLKRSQNHKAGFVEGEVSIGDFVSISETKPISKGKHFMITKVITKAKEAKHA